MLELISSDLTRTPVDTLAIAVCQDRAIHTNRIIVAQVARAKALEEFQGASGELTVLQSTPAIRAKRIVFLGLGKYEVIDAESLRQFAGKVVKQCIQWGLSDTTITVPAASKMPLDLKTLLTALAEGAVLGNHQFERYKKCEHPCLKRIRLHTTPAAARRFHPSIQRVETICQAAIQAREWVNTAPNDKRPEALVASIRAMARQAGLGIRVLTEKQLRQQKMGALLAVAAGSQSPARLVVLTHKPKNTRGMVALVGKGVTFDAGGLNLKPTGSIETMKMDMAGAAAVAATMLSVSQLGLNRQVVAIIPVVENMPSGSAVRPGDIITTYSGKTVEIGNTDAEGRLILADAMAYAVKVYRPDVIIDLATLTGACIVALGEKIAGVFSPDEKLREEILSAGRRTHERCWPLPLPEDYKQALKSDFADLNNIGATRWAGAITAALFLSEFVGDTRWAHIDIAGPAYEKKKSPYCGAGATGFGVRLLCDLIEKL